MSGLDLYQTQRALALLFVYAACTGFGLGGVYEVFRFLRILCGEPLGSRDASVDGTGSGSLPLGIIRFSADLLFSVIAAIVWVLLCYYASDGSFRAPALVGMAGGFFVYMQTLGRLMIPVENALTRLFKAMVRPLWRMAGRVAGFVGTVKQKRAERMRERQERIQTAKATKVLAAAARRGFEALAEETPPPTSRE